MTDPTVTERNDNLDRVNVVVGSSSIIFFASLFVSAEMYESASQNAVRADIPGPKPRSGQVLGFWDPCGFQRDHLPPHVRRHIYDIEGGGDASTATLLTTTRAADAWMKGPREAGETWRMSLPKARDVTLSLRRGYLFMFYSGFVMVGIEVAADSPSASAWFDLLHYGRFIDDRARMIEVSAKNTGNVAAVLRAIAEPATAADVDESGTSLTLTLPSLAPVLDLLLDTAGIHGPPRNPISSLTADMPVDPGQAQSYSVLVFEGNEAVRQSEDLMHRSRATHQFTTE